MLAISWRVLSAQSVGLVLSGGGSKGLTHIGVIKALEENRIPIDYIGGSSMGAIIGSLYAMGLSCDEMIAILSSDEFTYWLTGTLEEEDKYFFKEEREGPELLNIPIDTKDSIAKPRLPMSLIPSHLMDFAFMEIYSAASAAADYNFDSLFIPFLCIGADISNNKEVVFRKGDLAQAVYVAEKVSAFAADELARLGLGQTDQGGDRRHGSCIAQVDLGEPRIRSRLVAFRTPAFHPRLRGRILGNQAELTLVLTLRLTELGLIQLELLFVGIALDGEQGLVHFDFAAVHSA